MDHVTDESTADGEWAASAADCGAWSLPNTAAGNPWESTEPSTSSQHENPWEYEPASNIPKRTMDQNKMANDLKANLRSRAPELENPSSEFEELDVPETAIPHIVGHAHRTINALNNLPGITKVTMIMIKGADGNHEKRVQRVKVEGSSMAAINRVIMHIRRIVLRSISYPTHRELSVVCIQQRDKDEDAISLKLATTEQYQHYLFKHLKPFVIQHAPQDGQEKRYFLCDRRVSSDQVTNNAKFLSRKRRRSYTGDGSTFLFGSWDSSLYTTPISSCLRKVYEDSDLSLKGRPPLMKMRILFGKMFYFGTDLTAPEAWNVSLAEMESMTSEQTLRPCFSSYCHVDTVVKARKVLQASGYEQHNPESSQDTVCAELVDIDASTTTKPTFNIRFMQRDKIAAKINKKARRHAYVTFVDGMQGHDLQLRIQSRQKEPVLDENVRRLVFDAWSKRTGIEDPLISPSGHQYVPLRVLHKVFEYYKRGEIEVVLVQVSPVMELNNNKDLQDDNVESSCRWKISFQQSFIPTCTGSVDGDVEHTVTRVTELIAEAKRFSEAISS